MTRIPALIAFAALAAASSAAAQDVPEGARTVGLAATPNADLRTGFAGSGVVVSASSDSSAVALTFGRSWDSGKSSLGERGDADYALNSWSLKLSAPLDKSTGEGNFLVDGSLAKSTSLEFGYNRVVPPRSDEGRAALSAARRQALADGVAACTKAAADKLDPALLESERIKRIKAANEACMGKTLSDLVDDGHVPEALAATLVNAAFKTGWTHVFNVTGGVGYQSFDFKDPTTFEGDSVERTPYSVSLSYGAVPPGAFALLGLGVEYSQDYAKATARTLCQPPPAGEPQECVTASFARPDSEKVFDAFGFARWEGEFGVGRAALPYGVELKLAHDFENEVTGAGAALYVIPDKDKGLRGGLRLLWQTDDDDPASEDDNFTIGVFVSSAFSVF